MTKIEWATVSWNPVTGCDRISAGCKNCYMFPMVKRLQAIGMEKYHDGLKVRFHDNELDRPYKWKKPKKIFVCSMSDIFHDDLAAYQIDLIFNVIEDNSQHIFQVLTKRSNRMKYYSEFRPFANNIWVGVTIENESTLGRLYDLQQTKAKTKFLSCEPLLGSLPNLNLEGIDWVIVGGESGPKSKVRKMELDWARDIREQCIDQGVAFFFKQSGTLNPCDHVEWHTSFKQYCGGNKGCRFLDGMLWEQMP